MLSRKTIAALKVRHIATKGRPLKTYKVRLVKGTEKDDLLGRIALQ